MIRKTLGTLFSNVFQFVGTGGGMGASYFHGNPGSSGASSPTSTYASLVIEHEAVVYWKMSDASGAAGADAVVGGAAAFASAVNEASAGYSTMVSSMGDTSWNFDGVNDRLIVEEGYIGRSLHGAAAITFETWIEMDVLGANDAFFVTYVGNDGSNRFGISLDCTVANQLRFGARSRTGDTLLTCTHAVSAGELTRPLHIIGVANFANDRMSMWFDAVNVTGSVATIFSSSAYTYASAGLTVDDALGAIPGSSRWGNGRMGHTSLYASAMSGARIVQHYQWGKGDLP